MRKFNPKVIGLVIILLSFLVTGSLAVQKGLGDPTLGPDPGDDTGTD